MAQQVLKGTTKLQTHGRDEKTETESLKWIHMFKRSIENGGSLCKFKDTKQTNIL